jgi:hypothetical protein
MRHTGGLLRRAVSMVVRLETYGLEVRLGILSGLPIDRPETRSRPLGDRKPLSIEWAFTR